MENIVIYDASGFPDLVAQFEQNFLSMWDTGRDDYQSFLDSVQNGSGDVPIVFDSMALDWDQVDQLKDAISDVCPDLFSTEHRHHPERNYYCDRG